VNVLDVRKDERVVVFACDWVSDIYGFVKLLGGGVISERADSTGNEITSHSMLKALSLTREAFIST